MEAEYEFYVNGNIQDSFKRIEDILETTTNSYRNYPLRSLREMCKSMDNLSYYRKVVSRQGIDENLYFDEND